MSQNKDVESVEKFGEEELEEFLTKRANETWNQKNGPYFLAMVQPELNALNFDYKSVTGTTTLSQFSRNLDKVRVVQHPHQRAKIGLVPIDAGFEFDVSETPEPDTSARIYKKHQSKTGKRVVVDFLHALSELEDKDLDGFEIPALIIAKMLRK